jgi:trans-aconitate 2-methyltransferase
MTGVAAATARRYHAIMWDPAQYERFRAERARPFHDLCARIPGGPVGYAVDLGCGTGETTATLLDRWPEAKIVGVDNSPEMLASATARAVPDRLAFELGDLRTWTPSRPVDRLISNATLHWVPDHAAVLARLAGMLAPGGVLAVQMPNNFAAPSHVELRAAAAAGPWAARLRDAWEPNHAESVTWYAETLLGLGLEVDAWETTYVHVLPGEDGVLEWVKGTALRPILKILEGAEGERDAFLADYAARLCAAYPATPRGVLFPFRRIFFVARLS